MRCSLWATSTKEGHLLCIDFELAKRNSLHIKFRTTNSMCVADCRCLFHCLSYKQINIWRFANIMLYLISILLQIYIAIVNIRRFATFCKSIVKWRKGIFIKPNIIWKLKYVWPLDSYIQCKLLDFILESHWYIRKLFTLRLTAN